MAATSAATNCLILGLLVEVEAVMFSQVCDARAWDELAPFGVVVAATATAVASGTSKGGSSLGMLLPSLVAAVMRDVFSAKVSEGASASAAMVLDGRGGGGGRGVVVLKVGGAEAAVVFVESTLVRGGALVVAGVLVVVAVAWEHGGTKQQEKIYRKHVTYSPSPTPLNPPSCTTCPPSSSSWPCPPPPW